MLRQANPSRSAPRTAPSRRGRPRGGDARAAALGVLLGVLGLAVAAAGPARAQDELSYGDYQLLVRAANRLDHVAVMEPVDGGVGMDMVLGDRYGLVHVYHLTAGKSREVFQSKQLDGTVDEVRVADLDGDGYEDAFLARTSGGMVYVWSAESRDLLYESLPNDFTRIHALAIGNVDEDPQNEIVVDADLHIHYIDGLSFNRQWTSLHEYEATRLRIGDVDGDGTNELVLNSGQVLDSRSGDVEWAEEAFGNRVELLDMDGDGILEVLTESDGTVMKVFDIDHRKEKHLQ